ncbi:MAG: hypothetical protein A2Y12_11235 [Planctomycetes bacterium GWF2_42_9]|nr:MAG: hypothetical protein A2Y12_11235 [Planctomycetes bacterium GWF2_42_9]HAL45151.1 hypothetical protein [Phycisphaerales bacterium]
MEKVASSRTVTYLTIALGISWGVGFVLLITTSLFFLEKRAGNKLLDMIALAEPGTKLETIKGQLGVPMRVENDVEKVIEWGPFKNKQFCIGKKLHSFYAVTPTCRAIDIYTDANDVIVTATWHQL